MNSKDIENKEEIKMNLNPLRKYKVCGVDIDITIKSKQAQLLLAAAIFIIAIGIAWSFIKGNSTIIVKTDMKKHNAEKVEKPSDSIKIEIPTK